MRISVAVKMVTAMYKPSSDGNFWQGTNQKISIKFSHYLCIEFGNEVEF